MLLFYYLLMINILAFFLYAIDKKKAIKDQYRIPESRLILVAVLGGAVGAFLGMLIFHHKTKKRKFRIVVPLFLFLYTVVIILCLYGNYHIVVTQYEYVNNNVPEEMDGYRIVQISDLHNQLFGINQKSVLDKIKEQKPDIIVVTGDAVDSTHTSYQIASLFFEGAVKIAPTYYVSGNHEKWLIEKNEKKYNRFITDLEDMGVIYLDNSVVEVDGFRLYGMADSSFGSDISKTLSREETSDDSFEVLLAHEPKYLDDYAEAGADLVLTGHNHGGQIIVPGKGGLVSADLELFPEYDEGVFTKDKTTMIISRGLGNSILPVRINNYPEIVTVIITK